MVLTNGLTTSTLFWKYLEPRWARDHRFLAWDLPGHGQSGPARTTASARIAEQPEHVVQLMDAVGMSRAVQVGWSTGCQVVLELYRRYPERCSALVLLLGSAGRVLSTTRLLLPGTVIESLVRYAPRRLFGAALRGMALAGRAPFGQTLPRRARLIGRETSREDALLITQHLGRLHAPTVQTMVASAEEHSAWEILGDIQVPVLIVAGDRDPFAPAETVGVRMHAACPNSELVRLRRATHTALLDHADAIAAAVDAFVERRVVPARE
jgi:pimeloyl-ACP methyl ester carboxylesterase